MPVLLVTGGSRGIGAAAARLAARDGWDVAVNYVHDAKAARAVVAEVEAAGRKALAIQADVSDARSIEPMFDAVEERLGPLQGLVNSAGRTGRASTLAKADPQDIVKTVDLNVTALILVTHEAVRRMATDQGGKGGCIVNLSSGAATLGSPNDFVWYAATKGAVDSFTIGLSREVGHVGIRVNAVSPGLIETDIHADAGQPDRVSVMAPQIPMRRAGSAEEAAEPIVWLLSEKASYVTGAILRVAGGR